jgi:arylsulfatase A-like enzyme
VLSVGQQTTRSLQAASPMAERTRAPDVLVYMIDTLRADRLGVGGSNAPAVSPTIDRLARTGAWFEMALSSSPWTKPAIATLMSGILPNTHRVGAGSYTDRMPPTVALVQERFRAAGWRTASLSASPLGSTLSALDRGFAAAFPPRFWRGRAELDMNPSASQLSAALLDWIDEEPDQPFFAYVHTLEVHEWKLPRYQRDLPDQYTSYDAAVRQADLQLGRLLDELEQRGRQDDLVIVVVSDHGESWGDHGLPSHGFGLFQSQIHVPLVFWSGRGLSPERISTPVSLADLAPTLLDGFGLPPLAEADGRSLAGYLRGDPLEHRPVLSSLLRFVWAPEAPQQFAVTTPQQLKLIRTTGSPERAFDLVIDPRETHPLEHPTAATAHELDRMLADQARRAAAFRSRHGDGAPGAVTHDDVERLRALGYLPKSDDGLEPPD